jgi:hypothetical protein
MARNIYRVEYTGPARAEAERLGLHLADLEVTVRLELDNFNYAHLGPDWGGRDAGQRVPQLPDRRLPDLDCPLPRRCAHRARRRRRQHAGRGGSATRVARRRERRGGLDDATLRSGATTEPVRFSDRATALINGVGLHYDDVDHACVTPSRMSAATTMCTSASPSSTRISSRGMRTASRMSISTWPSSTRPGGASEEVSMRAVTSTWRPAS